MISIPKVNLGSNRASPNLVHISSPSTSYGAVGGVKVVVYAAYGTTLNSST